MAEKLAPPKPPRRQPLSIDFKGATAKQLVRAIFATVKPPDPSKRQPKMDGE